MEKETGKLQSFIFDDIKNIPTGVKERIEKSNVLLHIKGSDGRYSDVLGEIKKVDDYDMIIFINSDPLHYRCTNVYLNENDERADNIKHHFNVCSIRLLQMADAVIDENGHIYKNRWGVHDDDERNTYIMDTFTKEEILAKTFNKRTKMNSLEERCKKFATRNYVNSDGEAVATIVDEDVYDNAMIVAKTVKAETIEKACDAYCKICGHFAHTVPTHICRQDCRYYTDFKRIMEEKVANKKYKKNTHEKAFSEKDN